MELILHRFILEEVSNLLKIHVVHYLHHYLVHPYNVINLRGNSGGKALTVCLTKASYVAVLYRAINSTPFYHHCITFVNNFNRTAASLWIR